MGPPRRRAFTHILLAIVFLAGSLLAVAPTTDAQVTLATRDGAFAYGWTFPEGDGFPGGVADDPTGDVALTVDDAGAAPIGTAPILEALDLVEVRIDEPDAETLRLVLHVAALDPQRILAEHMMFGLRYESQFSVSGDQYLVISYVYLGCQADADPCEQYSDPALVVNSRMYRITADAREPVGYLPSRALIEEGRIEILLPRWALDGPPGAAAPVRGDMVDDLVVSSGSGYICILACFRILDRLPDDGLVEDVHALTLDSHGSRVRFVDGRGVPTDEDGQPQLRPLTPRILRMDVPTGEDAQVPMRIENLERQKALVLTSAEILSDHQVTLRVPKSLEVPANDVRKLLIGLEGETEFALDDPLVLRLTLESVGPRPAKDVATVLVRSVPALSPQDARLYFHTYGQANFLADTGVDTFAYSPGVLNTVADDPTDDGRGAVLNERCFCINNIYGWNALSGVSEVVHLDPESPALLHFEVDAPVAGTLELEPALTMGDLLVATGTHSVDLEEGANTVEVPLLVPEESAALEPGDGTFWFGFRATFRPGGVLGGEFAAIAEPVNPKLRTLGASWIELPVVDPAHRYANATHLALDLDRGVDRVQYVNSGRTTLWNITIGNQADEEDTITVDTQVPEGWKSRLVPGSSYRLGPGESVTVGLQATAPKDSTEGTTAEVVVKVASALAEGAAAGTVLSAVVTNGVAIAEPAYVADNETAARLADRTAEKESPGLPFVAMLLLVLLPAIVRRRSR